MQKVAVKEGRMAIAGPTGSKSNAEDVVKVRPGSNADAKVAAKEGPMVIAGPTNPTLMKMMLRRRVPDPIPMHRWR